MHICMHTDSYILTRPHTFANGCTNVPSFASFVNGMISLAVAGIMLMVNSTETQTQCVSVMLMANSTVTQRLFVLMSC